MRCRLDADDDAAAVVAGGAVVLIAVFFSSLTFAFHPNSYLVPGKVFLDKPWSQVSSLLPPGTRLYFLSRMGFSIPTARRFSSNVATSHALSRCYSSWAPGRKVNLFYVLFLVLFVFVSFFTVLF